RGPRPDRRARARSGRARAPDRDAGPDGAVLAATLASRDRPGVARARGAGTGLRARRAAQRLPRRPLRTPRPRPPVPRQAHVPGARRVVLRAADERTLGPAARSLAPRDEEPLRARRRLVSDHRRAA